MAYIPGKSNLIKGASYTLIKPCRERGFAEGTFLPPHEFTYEGVNGVGDHQDQHDFVDSEGRYIAFCPALGDDWSKYLR